MNVFTIFPKNFIRVNYSSLVLSLFIIAPLVTSAATTTTTTIDPNQIVSDYTIHKSKFFNYDVYKDLVNDTNNPKNTTKDNTQSKTYTPKSNHSIVNSEHLNDFDQPVFQLNRLYSNFYLGIGNMSDYKNAINYTDIITGAKNYKFLWVNSPKTLGFYTGLDLSFDLAGRKADKKHTDLQLSANNSSTSNLTSSKHRIVDPQLYSKYNAFGFNIGVILITGLKIDIYKRFSLLAELGGGVNYTLFTVPGPSFTKQVGDSLKYGLVGGQGQAYLGIDYNSSIEFGIRFTGSSTGYSSIGFLASLTY